jgi:hypothetical protein
MLEAGTELQFEFVVAVVVPVAQRSVLVAFGEEPGLTREHARIRIHAVEHDAATRRSTVVSCCTPKRNLKGSRSSIGSTLSANFRNSSQLALSAKRRLGFQRVIAASGCRLGNVTRVVTRSISIETPALAATLNDCAGCNASSPQMRTALGHSSLLTVVFAAVAAMPVHTPSEAPMRRLPSEVRKRPEMRGPPIAVALRPRAQLITSIDRQPDRIVLYGLCDLRHCVRRRPSYGELCFGLWIGSCRAPHLWRELQRGSVAQRLPSLERVHGCFDDLGKLLGCHRIDVG